MKPSAIAVLIVLAAVPAGAALVHDESIHGDFSNDDMAPTPLDFEAGGNTIIGTVGNTTELDRDFIAFYIPDGLRLIKLNLITFTPDNPWFVALNSGLTSYIPSDTTQASFLAGIHVVGEYVGTDILPRFVTDSVTPKALSTPELGTGWYSFVIQQADSLTTSYSLEFVLSEPIAATSATWSRIKAGEPTN